MAKYGKKLVDRIVQLLEQDLYSVSEVCELVRINRKTFYEWRNTRPEFREAVDDAIHKCEEMLLIAARISLKQKIEGYTLKEEKITYEPARSNSSVQIEKSRVVKSKQCPPDMRAIRYVIDRMDNKKKEEKPGYQPPIIYVQDENTAYHYRLVESRGQKWPEPKREDYALFPVDTPQISQES